MSGLNLEKVELSVLTSEPCEEDENLVEVVVVAEIARADGGVEISVVGDRGRQKKRGLDGFVVVGTDFHGREPP
jgi:hypothetical protein